MNELRASNFWADMNAAFIIFRHNHPDVNYAVIEEEKSEIIGIEMSDWNNYLFSHRDIRIRIVPEDHEQAVDFWNRVINDLYSKIERLRELKASNENRKIYNFYYEELHGS